MSLTPRARRALLLAGLMLAAVGLRVADWWDDRPDPEGPTATQVAPREAPRRRLPTRFFNPDAVPLADDAPADRGFSGEPLEQDVINLDCSFAVGRPPTGVAWLRAAPDDEPGRPVVLTDTGFWAHRMPIEGAARLHIDGLDPVEVTWSGGVCDPVVLPRMQLSTLTVRVEDPLAAFPVADSVFVSGCGLPGMRVQPGEPVEVTLRPREPCTLDAWRNDGLFRALALPELVELEPGEDLDLTMVLPEERMGGMGFQFQPLDDSVAVRRVYEDTPAWNAGLRSGDRILAVDGEPTDDMDPNDFVILGTGPEGSVVHLEVEHEDGSVVEVDIERALLN
jgi:hypothetical protein